MATEGDKVQDERIDNLYRISGASGDNAMHCNGFYQQQIAKPGERPRFHRLLPKPCEDPIVIWYYQKRSCWMVSHRSQIDTDTARAIVKQDVDHPEDITQIWYVFNPEKPGFEKCGTFMFTLATPEEEDQNRAPFIVVEGRKAVGYNRAMNGFYKRGDRMHAGKNYYCHVANEFKIRWYESKWVIDWRQGLKNDNVGAAVVKEDVPEPWMVTVPWRVYDGKAKGKKWVYDRDVLVRGPKKSDSYWEEIEKNAN